MHKVWDKSQVYNNRLWQEARELVLIRAGLCKCENCGRHDRLEVHHVLKARLSNAAIWYDPANLLAVCVPCHRQLDAAAAPDQRTERMKEWDEYYGSQRPAGAVV